jgi:hypothetical protein
MQNQDEFPQNALDNRPTTAPSFDEFN